jgi:hypothetical protein
MADPTYSLGNLSDFGYNTGGSSFGIVGGSGGSAGGIGSIFGPDGGGNSGSSSTLGNIGSIAEILAGLGNVWNGFQEQQTAKKALNFQKDVFNKNFNANRMAYNARVEDTLRARASQTGQNYDNVIAERRL